MNKIPLTINRSSKDDTALSAKEYAQHIAFAPMVFQASRVLRNSGVLEVLERNAVDGLSLESITAHCNLNKYAVRVLVEAGLGIGLIDNADERYFITKTGSFILNDEMTRVNMDFVHDVCYKGMFSLDESVRTGTPTGLKELGSWSTVYEGLSSLPKQVQNSWFAFDHFYSDVTFRDVLPLVFEKPHLKLLDIGGNTGKWALQCLRNYPACRIGLADLPGQLEMAQKNIHASGFSDRVSYHEIDLLDENKALPEGYDAIWMSQFLDCFSEEQIVSILERCRSILPADGVVFILEPFWDRQKFSVSAFCLQMTSLYFTNIANGNSQMYSAADFYKLVERAGFRISGEVDDLGISHTLLKCIPR